MTGGGFLKRSFAIKVGQGAETGAFFAQHFRQGNIRTGPNAIRGGVVCVAKGNLSDAEKLSMRPMKVGKKMLGKEHEDTLNSMAVVGLAAKFE